MRILVRYCWSFIETTFIGEFRSNPSRLSKSRISDRHVRQRWSYQISDAMPNGGAFHTSHPSVFKPTLPIHSHNCCIPVIFFPPRFRCPPISLHMNSRQESRVPSVSNARRAIECSRRVVKFRTFFFSAPLKWS